HVSESPDSTVRRPDPRGVCGGGRARAGSPGRRRARRRGAARGGAVAASGAARSRASGPRGWGGRRPPPRGSRASGTSTPLKGRPSLVTAYPGPVKEFWIYTLLRVVLFLASFGIVVGVWFLIAGEAQLLWAIVIAFLMSGLGSYFVLDRQREALARRVQT